MQISKAVEGFILHMQSGNYADNTVKLYRFVLAHLVTFAGNDDVENITGDQLQTFMGTLKIKSGSYQDNHWKAIRTFYAWCSETLKLPRVDDKLPRPHFKTPEVIPFTEGDIKKILGACTYVVAQRANTQPYKLRRPNALRDTMIVLLLLDTGLRIGELCRLEIRDVDLQTGEVVVAPYSTGRKTRPRTVFLGAAARRATWHYLAKREYSPDDQLIETSEDTIRKVLKQIGVNAGVYDVHPHRFRHTFAIQFLRNGGDVFTLQRLLGHSSLDMVLHYLKLADADSAAAHKRASPADRWKL